MIDRVPAQKCCICGACANACPKQAITFTKLTNGFSYPQIDEDTCIGCNLCERVCPVTNPCAYSVEDTYPKAFAARSKDVDNRKNSTSGAIFFEAGNVVISHGGFVCGTIFDDHFQVKHVLTNSAEELRQMRGSKYAQSDVGDTYIQIKQILDGGNEVLFCGCPCQVFALKRVLGKEYTNLFLMDLICHGIPSQDMLDSYMAELEEWKKAKIVGFRFRDKTKGWHSSSVAVTFDNGEKYSNPVTVDPYMKAFHSGTTMKESCYACQFKGFSSGSDLTLGDFWGAEVELKDWDDNTGISAVLVNREKGLQLLECLPVQKQTVELDCIIRYNKNLLYPTEKNPIREQFWEYAYAHGSGKALMHFFEETKWEKLKRTTRYQLRCLVHKLSGRGKPLY